MNRYSPIGMFDSGIGGTSIYKEVHQLLPNEHIIYLADSKNAPYGPKGKRKIIEFSIRNTDFLLDKGCKLIIVACNTATTNAIAHLREAFDVPFIGIEPAIKPAALNTQTGSVGILATKGTLSSELFHQTSHLFASDINVIEREGLGLVELIEQGKLESDAMKELLSQYIQPMIEADIDHLVLGCTHYPYLIPMLQTMLPTHVTIIDSGEAVARQTKKVLSSHSLLHDGREDHPPRQEFYTTGDQLEVMQSFVPEEYKVQQVEV